METYGPEETVALAVVGAVPAVMPTTDGPTTLLDMVQPILVEVEVVEPETETSSNSLSTAEVTSQETVVPEARVL
jgi:hypothetical protein